MTVERSSIRGAPHWKRVAVLAAGALVFLVALQWWGQAAVGAPPEGKGDFAGPSPEDIRSFTCEVSDAAGTCTFIRNPGEQSGFVVTDLVADAVGSTDAVAVRLASASDPELGVFWIRLDAGGHGARDLHFESGVVAQTAPGSLFISKISGNGTVWLTLSGYYFSEGS